MMALAIVHKRAISMMGAGNPLPEGEGRVRGRPFDVRAATSPQRLSDARITGPGADTSPLPLSLQERGSPRACRPAAECFS